MNDLTKLISVIQKDAKMDNEDIIMHLCKSIENGDYESEYIELYKEAYGEKLNRETAECWVSKMTVPNGVTQEDGTKWSFETAVEAGTKASVDWNKIRKTDWFAVLNMMYSDYYETAKKIEKQNDVSFFASLAKDWLCDEDAGENKLFNYYFFVVKA